MIRSGKAVLGIFILVGWSLSAQPAPAGEAALKLTQRSRVISAKDKTRFEVVVKEAAWKAKQTAIIVCDMWDSHHSLNAVQRVVEIAPRMNQVLEKARNQGVLIIHAPSSCMEPYKAHPARIRAQDAPRAAKLPPEIDKWCRWIPSEEKDKYPIDQSDGGCDTPAAAQKAWQEKLKADGRNPAAPWKKQIDLIKIHDQDALSESGSEIWNLLVQRKIDNVILVGVHTNMCVLGRPFGLRQMAKNGKNVVLMRDMTDTMYNPARWPYVAHFQGTDLIVQHIEKYVCPTITSDQILGGRPFRFKDDVRKNAAVIVAEWEYDTKTTLPVFAREVLQDRLGLEFTLLIREKDHVPLPDLGKAILRADLVVLSVRRQAFPPEDLQILKQYLARGKPLLALRTSSHAFDTRGKAPKGMADWPAFDAEVLGGNYHNHHKVGPVTSIQAAAGADKHPILNGITLPFTSKASLYRTSPLKKGTSPLLIGSIPEQKPEPVAWTNRPEVLQKENAKASIFYTALGHREDFRNPQFVRLLHNAARWLVDMPVPDGTPKKIRNQF